jgi:hypothetical protein
VSQNDRDAEQQAIGLAMLYAGTCALLVPALLIPGFLERVLFGGTPIQAGVLFIGPFLFVTLLAALDRRAGR